MDPIEIQSQRATDDLFKAQAHLYSHVLKYMHSVSLKCAVDLGIPDVVHSHGNPMTFPVLVSALGIHPAKTGCLYRLMRMLVSSGFFATTKASGGQEEEGGEGAETAYALTPSSWALVKDNPNCLSAFVKSLISPTFISLWHSLGDWFRGHELTAFEKAHGMPFWDFQSQNPEFGRLFDEAMACDARMMNLVAGECKPIFEGVDSMVDVGGGTGSLARIISEAFPHIKCTVLELPQVIANLESNKNLNFVVGDMFQHIPSADAIVLKLILHGWSDEDCIKILKKSREAISGKGKGGKVIIIDVVIDEKKDERVLTETKLLFDILMMVVANGIERTEKEWKRLFLDAGFSHYKITPLLGLRSLIEVYP